MVVTGKVVPLGHFVEMHDMFGTPICSGDLVMHMAGRGRGTRAESLNVAYGKSAGGALRSICVAKSLGSWSRSQNEPLPNHPSEIRWTSFIKITNPLVTGSRIDEARAFIQENS